MHKPSLAGRRRTDGVSGHRADGNHRGKNGLGNAGTSGIDPARGQKAQEVLGSDLMTRRKTAGPDLDGRPNFKRRP